MTRSKRARALGGALAAMTLALASPGRSEPQWNSSISAGIAGVGSADDWWDKTQFYGGLRGDVLFLRDGPRTFGLGPSVTIATSGFADVRAVGGAMALVPLGDLWGFSLEPALYFRSSEAGSFPGWLARAWFGIQTYNYQGGYAPRGGLTLGYAQDFGGSDAHALVIAAEIDGLVLALPAILLYESLRGHADE